MIRRQQCSCGWTFTYQFSVTVTCPRCKASVTLDGAAPVVEAKTVDRKCCIHRGDLFGPMECNCGVVYHCKLLNNLCSTSKPIDEFVFATNGTESIQLNSQHFTNCKQCKHFSTGQP